MRELRFELSDSTEALESFVPQWVTLFERDLNATPFQHPAWLLPMWRQFGSKELCSVAVFRGDLLRAFLPLYIYTEPGTRERKLMLLGVGTSDYLDGVYAPECAAGDVVDALHWLAERRNWDALSLVQLRSGSLLLEAAHLLGGQEIATEACSKLHACAIADLPVKIRRNAMYYGNAVRRRGALDLIVAESSNCLQRFDELVRLHTERWQGRGEAGVLADPHVLAWHREAVPLLAAAGLLRIYRLTLDGEAIAAMYALADPAERTNRTAYFYLPGFSVFHGDLRPGTLLMAMAMEHAAAEGIATIDLLRGNESYKQHWRAEPVETFGCTLPFERFVRIAAPELVAVA